MGRHRTKHPVEEEGHVEPELSPHAAAQTCRRRISPDALAAAIEHGRCWHRHGAWVYRLDRRMVELAQADGLDLRAHEGVTVVVQDGVVMTVWRNREGRRVWRGRRWRNA